MKSIYTVSELVCSPQVFKDGLWHPAKPYSCDCIKHKVKDFFHRLKAAALVLSNKAIAVRQY